MSPNPDKAEITASGAASTPNPGSTSETSNILPVTLLSGFLGAGKTTLLKQILRNKQDMKVAIIVNDMGAINLDAEEVVKHKLVQEKSEMVELHNGCICCTLRGDLLRTVKELSEENKYDYLVIESTGIAEPLPVAQTFVMDVNTEKTEHDHNHGHNHEHGHSHEPDPTKAEFEPLSRFSRMDTLVTVLDTFNFFKILHQVETFADRLSFLGPEELQKQEAEEGEESSVAQLLIDQIEFANVILLNKTDLLKKEDKDSTLTAIKNLVTRLNPKAKVIIPENPKFENFPVNQVLNTGLFDMEKASKSAGWLAELSKPAHVPETEEYGISSFVFRENQRPFHPERLYEITKGFGQLDVILGRKPDTRTENTSTSLFAGVVRSKGQLWLANADACPVDIHSAGRQLELVPVLDRPWCKKLMELHPNGDTSLPNSVEQDCDIWEDFGIKGGIERFKREGNWTENFGDRNSELVCIGMQMDKVKLVEALRSALLTDEEMSDRECWKSFEDPIFDGARLWTIKDLIEWNDDDDDDDDDEEEDESCSEVTDEENNENDYVGDIKKAKKKI